MIRLAVAVEGATEREFVKGVLAEHLRVSGIEATPILLGRARGSHGGGNVSTERLASEMSHLYWKFDAVTSLVDLYGFRDDLSGDPEALQERLFTEIENRIGHEVNRAKVLPYVQRYEFEALLFSNAGVFADLPGVSGESVRSLQQMRLQYHTPEDINDDSETAPSKRILRAIPRYRKVVNGPPLTAKIGLTVIRAECPRFGAWLTRLESLGTGE